MGRKIQITESSLRRIISEAVKNKFEKSANQTAAIKRQRKIDAEPYSQKMLSMSPEEREAYNRQQRTNKNKLGLNSGATSSNGQNSSLTDSEIAKRISNLEDKMYQTDNKRLKAHYGFMLKRFRQMLDGQYNQLSYDDENGRYAMSKEDRENIRFINATKPIFEPQNKPTEKSKYRHNNFGWNSPDYQYHSVYDDMALNDDDDDDVMDDEYTLDDLAENKNRLVNHITESIIRRLKR